MSSKEKVVIINGKRFIVGNTKVKPTKCPDYSNPNRKKLLSKEERTRENVDKKTVKNKKNKTRQSKRISRKKRE
jgi:hypothetical protein